MGSGISASRLHSKPTALSATKTSGPEQTMSTKLDVPLKESKDKETKETVRITEINDQFYLTE